MYYISYIIHVSYIIYHITQTMLLTIMLFKCSHSCREIINSLDSTIFSDPKHTNKLCINKLIIPITNLYIDSPLRLIDDPEFRQP